MQHGLASEWLRATWECPIHASPEMSGPRLGQAHPLFAQQTGSPEGFDAAHHFWVALTLRDAERRIGTGVQP